jgi:hypothetical protein
MGGPSRKDPRPGHIPRTQRRSDEDTAKVQRAMGLAVRRQRRQPVTKGVLQARLSEAQTAVERADRRVAQRVKEARDFGLSWAEIGDALGRTGQAVGKRYGRG